jgi:SpoVK/Ycf46/Vps4 family AAA+-type ATPase
LRRPDELDEAARRRFSKRLYIPLPNAVARREIIVKMLSSHLHHLKDADLDRIAARTDGCFVTFLCFLK